MEFDLTNKLTNKARIPDIHSASTLAHEQAATLASERRSYGVLAILLFLVMDVVYGKRRTLSKFKVLEIVARVPYQAWEQVAYIVMTHTFSKPGFARRVFEFVKESRAQQDNEQWHLLILEEMTQKQGVPQGFFRYRVLPQALAFFYYQISWLLYVISPSASYRLNADFEDHAEHEYMHYVAENPAFEAQPFDSEFASDYGSFESTADLFRQIGLDERHHKEESLARLLSPRFA